MSLTKRAIEDCEEQLREMTDKEIVAYHNICAMNTRMISSGMSRDRNAVHLEACRWIIRDRNGSEIEFEDSDGNPQLLRLRGEKFPVPFHSYLESEKGSPSLPNKRERK